MKKSKMLLSFLLVVTVIATSVGCTNTAAPSASAAPPSSVSEAAIGSEAPSSPETTAAMENATVKFVDSVGREVEISANIERIAPSGPLAQVVLYTLCPDKLVGLGSDLSDKQFEYIDERYKELPVFGNFYADTLNMEAVMAAKPQIVIDIGETKATVDEA